MDAKRFSTSLGAARRRFWAQTFVRWTALGASGGALIGLSIVISGWLVEREHSRPLAAAAALAGALIGGGIGFLRRPSLRRTALAIDETAEFKGRYR